MSWLIYGFYEAIFKITFCISLERGGMETIKEDDINVISDELLKQLVSTS